MGGGEEKKVFFPFWIISHKWKITQVQQSTDPGLKQLRSCIGTKVLKLWRVFLFSKSLQCVFKQVKLWNRCNKKGRPRKPTQVYFSVIGMAKKKEKGTWVVAKWLSVTAWGTEWEQFSLPPPPWQFYGFRFLFNFLPYNCREMFIKI